MSTDTSGTRDRLWLALSILVLIAFIILIYLGLQDQGRERSFAEYPGVRRIYKADVDGGVLDITCSNDMSICIAEVFYMPVNHGPAFFPLYSIKPNENIVAKTIGHEGHHPSLSGSGQRLAFLGDGGLRIAHRNGVRIKEFSQWNSYYTYTDWSLDEKGLVIFSHDSAEEASLYIYHLENDVLEKIYEIKTKDKEYAGEVALSPDERYIAFVVEHYIEGHDIEQGDIYLLDRHNNETRRLTNTDELDEDNIEWKDGRTLVFIDELFGDISMLDVETGCTSTILGYNGVEQLDVVRFGQALAVLADQSIFLLPMPPRLV